MYVVKNGRILGVLTEYKDIITFKYNDEIIENEFIQGLEDRENSSKVLFPVFQNVIPENEQIELLKIKHGIRNRIDVLSCLDDIHGSFEFYTEGTISQFYENAKEQVVYNFDDKKNSILESNYTYPNILHDYKLNIDDEVLYPSGSVDNKIIGISGFQYKFSIVKDDENKTISIDDNVKGLYFMKPYNEFYTTFKLYDKDRSYIPYLLINEHIHMTFARDCGFDIPYNAIIKHKHDYHYIIKRYDRFENSSIDHTELLTLMDKTSKEKYNVTMKEVLLEAKSRISDQEFKKLVKFVIFSIIIAHGDLHAKNLSLIYSSNKSDENNMQLSPFYDIATTKIYKDTKQKVIGLKILNKTFNIKTSDLHEFGKTLDVESSEIDAYVKELSNKFIKNFKNYIELLPHTIKSLPVYIGKYGRAKPFQQLLNEHYNERVDYLKNNLGQQIDEFSWD